MHVGQTPRCGSVMRQPVATSIPTLSVAASPHFAHLQTMGTRFLTSAFHPHEEVSKQVSTSPLVEEVCASLEGDARRIPRLPLQPTATETGWRCPWARPELAASRD